MLSLFNQANETDARAVFDEVRKWIYESGFLELKKWWVNLDSNWQTVEIYFLCRVTTAMSEGIKNVIKSIKRRAFGFRNMTYFMLKILQRCGFLNSHYMTDDGQWTAKAVALKARGIIIGFANFLLKNRVNLKKIKRRLSFWRCLSA